MKAQRVRPSRREFVKYGLAATAALGLPLSADLTNALAAAPKGENILIVYYSRTGNTRRVAEMIQARVGGDLVELKTAVPYAADYDTCVDQAKKEQQENARPAITTEIPNMDKYKTVFIGYPNWWGTMPMAFFTFLDKYNMDGKTLAPFCTHGGSQMGRSESDIKKLCPGARLLKGLAVRGTRSKNAGSDVDAWLSRIVF